jgi:peptidoglycan/xylan/chitin deacetylase (PgdA/CDA1 family)
MRPEKNNRPRLGAFIAVAVLALVLAGVKLFLETKFYPPVLMYHNVEDLPGGNAMYVTGAQFREQMKFLREHKYNVLSLDALANILESGGRVPRNTVAVTFDDGNANNYLNAFPVLKEYGIPATVFMISDYIGRDGYLTITQIRKMSAAGIDFGSHTRSHLNFKDAPERVIASELLHSKKIIEEVTGKKVTAFCYPFGERGACTSGMLERAGYRTAFVTTLRDGSVKLDRFALKRIKIETSRANMLEFRLKVSGYYSWLKSAGRKKKN